MQDLLLQLEYADGLFTVDPGRTQKSNVRDSHQSHQRPADSSTDGRWSLVAGCCWALVAGCCWAPWGWGLCNVHCVRTASSVSTSPLAYRLAFATQAVSIQT